MGDATARRRAICWMAFHFAAARANVLTIEAGDPVTQTPELKHCAIRIDKVPVVPVVPDVASVDGADGVAPASSGSSAAGVAG